MSGIKKRPPPPQSLLQQHTQYLLTQMPECKEILTSSLSLLHTPFLLPSSATSLSHEWTDSKKRGLKAMQTFAQTWIQHCSDAVSGASILQLYTDSFGPLTTPTTAVEERVLQSLSEARHRAAMRNAQVQLQHMRDSLAQMRKTYEKLTSIIKQLRSNWTQLYQATQSISTAASSSTAPHSSPSLRTDNVSLSTPKKSSPSSSIPTGSVIADDTTSMQEELLENVRIEKLLPTDLALSSNSNVTLEQAIVVLSDLQRMYEHDLHTKHSIVDAIAVIIDNTLPAPTSQGNTSSQRESIPIDQNQVETSARLLQQPTVPLSEGNNATQTAVAASAKAAAAQDDLRFNNRNEPLEYYLSTWMFEPDLSVQTSLNFKYIWETQLGPAVPAAITSSK